MNTLNTSMTVIFVIWILIMLKLSYDSMKLRKTYAAEIDSTLPQSTSEMDLGTSNQIKMIKKSLRITLAKYPEHPEVDKYARRVRTDFFSMLALFVLLILIAIIFTAVSLNDQGIH